MADNDKSALDRFILPEREVSLKLVFDNFRNYAIIGALGAMAHWFQSGKAIPPPLIFRSNPTGGWEAYSWICLGIAAVLFMLNITQSYHIAKRLYVLVALEGGTRVARRIPTFAHYFLAMFFVTIAIAMTFLIAILAIYIVWFTVVGGVR